YWRPLNEIDQLKQADNMPAKWQMLISLGQQTILHMQEDQRS
ncbi:MAG: transposase, partial [Clostridium sp.]|nr:transposase [Clostridium sp.]